jgi:hypothetical protein
MAFSLKRAVANNPNAQIGAAGAAGNPLVGNFMTYTTDFNRSAAIQIPTISRARDLICSMVSCLDIHQYGKQWVGDSYEDLPIPDDTWFHQPDPNVTRNFIMSWTTDDLLFYGRAFWIVTSDLEMAFPRRSLGFQPTTCRHVTKLAHNGSAQAKKCISTATD